MTHEYHLPALMAGSFALLVQVGQGQPDCVVGSDEVDPFTRQRVVTVAPKALFTGPAYQWKAMNDTKFIELSWCAPGGGTLVVLEWDTLFVLLESDVVLKLLSVRTEVGRPSADRLGNPCSLGQFGYAVSAQQAQLLAHTWVKGLRLYHSGGFLEFDAANDPLWQHGFVKTTNCFLSVCGRVPVPANAVAGEQQAIPVQFSK